MRKTVKKNARRFVVMLWVGLSIGCTQSKPAPYYATAADAQALAQYYREHPPVPQATPKPLPCEHGASVLRDFDEKAATLTPTQMVTFTNEAGERVPLDRVAKTFISDCYRSIAAAEELQLSGIANSERAHLEFIKWWYDELEKKMAAGRRTLDQQLRKTPH